MCPCAPWAPWLSSRTPWLTGNAKNEYIETPYDDPIQNLNSQLNQTYIPYGLSGERGFANQQAQDSNAKKMSKSSAIQRSIAKSNSYYSNDQWDLVDAVRNQKVDLSKLDPTFLPPELQKLDAPGRQAYVQKKQEQVEIRRTSIS